MNSHPVGVWFCFGCGEEWHGDGQPPWDWLCKCAIPTIAIEAMS